MYFSAVRPILSDQVTYVKWVITKSAKCEAGDYEIREGSVPLPTNGKIISTEVSVTLFNGNHYFARKTRDQFSAPRMSDKPHDRQLVKKGDTFQTLGGMESFIKA